MSDFAVGLAPLAFDPLNFLCAPKKPAREPKKPEAINPVFPDPEINPDGTVNLFNEKNKIYTGGRFDAYFMPVIHKGLNHGHNVGKQILELHKNFPNRKILILTDEVINPIQPELRPRFSEMMKTKIIKNEDNFIKSNEYYGLKADTVYISNYAENIAEKIHQGANNPGELFFNGIVQELSQSDIRRFLELAPPESIFSSFLAKESYGLAVDLLAKGDIRCLNYMKKKYFHHLNSIEQRNAQVLNRAYRLSKIHENAVVVLVMGDGHDMKNVKNGAVINFLDINKSMSQPTNEYSLFFHDIMATQMVNRIPDDQIQSKFEALMNLTNRIQKHHVISLLAQFKKNPTKQSELFNTWLQKEVDPKQESTFWKAMAQ